MTRADSGCRINCLGIVLVAAVTTALFVTAVVKAARAKKGFSHGDGSR